MAKDFEQNGHKNIELLRFYVSKDINRIEKKIQKNESDLLGYFVGSLVDLFIVVLFDQGIDSLFSEDQSSWKQVVLKILVIALLLCIFFLVSWITTKIRTWGINRSRESGKREYEIKEEQQRTIDDFDNIACDGLLICENYIRKYSKNKKDYMKDFYKYEIIHHLTKAGDIFDQIYEHKALYVSVGNHELLDSYRINNFIEIFQNIVSFLRKEIPENSGDPDLDVDMDYLTSFVNKWKAIPPLNQACKEQQNGNNK